VPTCTAKDNVVGNHHDQSDFREPRDISLAGMIAVVNSGKIAQINVTNAGSVGRPGCVLVTPYAPSVPTSVGGGSVNPSVHQQPLINKLLLKAVSDSTKKDAKTFTIRKVNPGLTKTCESLKDVIREQLTDDIISSDFDVGYIEGNTAVSLRSAQDLLELWEDINQGKKVVMWCDGLKEEVCQKSRKRKAGNEGDEISRFNVAREEKDRKVDQVISSLNETHTANFTSMQYRIWAEMITGGIYSSYDNPPSSSMFTGAGGGTTTPKKKSSDMNESLSDIAKCLCNVLSPPGTSPAKAIDSRSKCYKQLTELNNLRISGVLDEDEYIAEKNAVMTILKKVDS
jgi:hypothetical protein